MRLIIKYKRYRKRYDFNSFSVLSDKFEDKVDKFAEKHFAPKVEVIIKGEIEIL